MSDEGQYVVAWRFFLSLLKSRPRFEALLFRVRCKIEENAKRRVCFRSYAVYFSVWSPACFWGELKAKSERRRIVIIELSLLRNTCSNHVLKMYALKRDRDIGRRQFNKIFSSQRGRDHLGDLDTDGRIILNWILKETGCDCVDWIQVAHDRVQWRASMTR
jgi:hypothetical protein